MNKATLQTYLAVMAIGLILINACAADAPLESLPVGSNPDLIAHSAEFIQEVIKVTDGVYVAVGFGLANSVLLEGDDGVVIVDTMESAEAAVTVKDAFNKITTKPVKAIIYTHYHPDHTLGAGIMAGDDNPDIYSHADTSRYLERIATITRETTHRRGMRQFGSLLPHGGLINAGIGPRLVNDGTHTIVPLTPTKKFSENRYKLEISGLEMVLFHAPGETPDQIFIWLPEKKVLLPADNYYKSFPNLYAIRGTAYRDVQLWVNTVAGFRFPDTGETFTVHVRRGVAEIRPQFPENPDIALTVDSTVWKEVVTGFRNPALALVKDVDKEGGTLEIVRFLNLFKSDD
jgi:alkyl sulfatase BDS1-like metallo-beta-lactamase superfamily hydrolase